jgi:hypothetical protein
MSMTCGVYPTDPDAWPASQDATMIPSHAPLGPRAAGRPLRYPPAVQDSLVDGPGRADGRAGHRRHCDHVQHRADGPAPAAPVWRRSGCDRQAAVVVGVMPSRFDFPKGTELWMPFRLNEAEQRERQKFVFVRIVARARGGDSPARVAHEMDRLTSIVEHGRIRSAAASVSAGQTSLCGSRSLELWVTFVRMDWIATLSPGSIKATFRPGHD